MSSKNDILNNLKRHINIKYDMPNLNINAIQYPDILVKFIEASKSVGGNAIEVDNNNINELIKKLYPTATSIASNLPEIEPIATINIDEIEDPRELNNTDLSVIRGEIGIAENGAIWIPQNVKQRAIYFIAEYLVIILDKKKIVNNMHEAYEKINFSDIPYGCFISGPSKTADIEQALVVGAHGAKGVTVILK